MSRENMTFSLTGYEVLFEFFQRLDIQLFSGVTGGGVIHFLKYISPWSELKNNGTRFFTLAEYSAGFVPLGYYLSTGKIAASVATLGAATKLLTCGLSDAKLHDIPAVYIVPAYDKDLFGKAPLQDSSSLGSNMIEQLKAESPESVFVFDDVATIKNLLVLAEERLFNSKPIVFVLIHSILSQPILNTQDEIKIFHPKFKEYLSLEMKMFVSKLITMSKNKKITILVGEEMARYSNAKTLLNNLADKIKPYLVWSMNGANAVDRNNPYSYGYLGFGGNDLAINHFQNLNEDDVLLVLGACPDEYTVNLKNFTAGSTFFCGHILNAYGQINQTFEHRAQNEYIHLYAALDELISELLNQEHIFENLNAPVAPLNLNIRHITPPCQKYVNMEHFYQQIDLWWPEKSIAFSDVCLAYKDRQYVTQRPHNNVDFYSLYRGSAMGYSLGAAIGAKLAKPTQHVFIFTGDGCFKLFSGSLAEAAHLGITLFVLNNQMFSIVEQGLKTILSETSPEYWHASVIPIDYCLLAQANGWQARKLNPDLSNLSEILNIALDCKQSLLVEIPVDPDQLLGINPRVHNL